MTTTIPLHSDCDHEWRADPRDGCVENPGVWSLGGTTIVTTEYCLRCSRRRQTLTSGSQRNPGERDTVAWRRSRSDMAIARWLRQLTRQGLVDSSGAWRYVGGPHPDGPAETTRDS